MTEHIDEAIKQAEAILDIERYKLLKKSVKSRIRSLHALKDLVRKIDDGTYGKEDVPFSNIPETRISRNYTIFLYESFDEESFTLVDTRNAIMVIPAGEREKRFGKGWPYEGVGRLANRYGVLSVERRDAWDKHIYSFKDEAKEEIELILSAYQAVADYIDPDEKYDTDLVFDLTNHLTDLTRP